MQRQAQQPPKATLRLLFADKALTEQLSGQDPEAQLTLFARLLHYPVELQKRSLGFLVVGILLSVGLLEFLGQLDDESPLFGRVFMLLMGVGGSVVILWLVVGWLTHEKNRQINRILTNLWQTSLITRALWPQALHTLLALMEQTGWPRDDALRLWWWGETYPILVRWLPRLQPGELGPDECRTLRKLLRLNHQYEDLQVAILLALGMARDAKALRVATRLFRSSPHERVREAARDCLRELDEPSSRRLERRD